MFSYCEFVSPARYKNRASLGVSRVGGYFDGFISLLFILAEIKVVT